MTVGDLGTLLTGVGLTVTAVTGVWNLIVSRATHKATNSMKDELVVEVRKAAHSAGVAEGSKVATDDARQAGIQKGIELASTVQP